MMSTICKRCFKTHVGSYIQDAFCTECLNEKYHNLLDLKCIKCNDVLTHKDFYRFCDIKHRNTCNFCIEIKPEYEYFGE